MDYPTFKARAAELERACSDAAATLRAIPGNGAGPMGLTPDSVKARPDWQAARAAHAAAFARLRALNGAHAARFKAEIRADIAARRRGPVLVNLHNAPDAPPYAAGIDLREAFPDAADYGRALRDLAANPAGFMVGGGAAPTIYIRPA